MNKTVHHCTKTDIEFLWFHLNQESQSCDATTQQKVTMRHHTVIRREFAKLSGEQNDYAAQIVMDGTRTGKRQLMTMSLDGLNKS